MNQKAGLFLLSFRLAASNGYELINYDNMTAHFDGRRHNIVGRQVRPVY